MLWLRYDLKNRLKFLSALLTSLNMSRIPLSYFIENIEKEEIIKSNCSSNTVQAKIFYNYYNRVYINIFKKMQ